MFRRSSTTAYRVTSQARRHRLTFRSQHLAPVESGAKCATLRFTSAAAAARPGDVLVLAFGRYDRPVVLEATVRRAEVIDLEAELVRAFTLPEHVRSLVEERRFYEQPLEPDDRTPEALLEALRDSGGGDYAAVLAEAAERGVSACTALWWTLT